MTKRVASASLVGRLNREQEKEWNSNLILSNLITMQKYQIEKLIKCCSMHVTYILECSCGLQYVGRRMRKLSIKIGEHIKNIKKGFRYHSVSNHFRIKHNRDPEHLKFYAIDKIDQHWRNLNLRNEIYWMFKLNNMKTNGLNVELDINCFIEDYYFCFYKKKNPKTGL